MLSVSMVLSQMTAVCAEEVLEAQVMTDETEVETEMETAIEPEYVVMAESVDEIFEVVGGELLEEQDEYLTEEDAVIVAMDLTDAEVEQLQQEEIVVEENIDFVAAATDSVTATAVEDWNLEAVHAEAYTEDFAAGEKVKIAILDSGISYRTDMLVEDYITNLDKDIGSFQLFTDATGHGTAVASIINATSNEESIQGMNQDAEVYSIQVLDGYNVGKLSWIVDGIYWSIENDMDIINMSFGTEADSEILHKAIQDAEEAGILMIAAAGNTGTEEVLYPAAYEEVIAVGATNMQGEIAEDSARGEQVDIYAPGESIRVNDWMFDMTIASGTSMACAEITAAASVIWEKDKTKDAEFVRGLLEETANKRVDKNNTNGLLDVEEAMEQYGSYRSNENPDSYGIATAELSDITEEKPLVVYDEEEVKALWGSKTHLQLIKDSNVSQGHRILYAASICPDYDYGYNGSNIDSDYCKGMKKNRRFHASQNYKKILDFLVNLAHAYYIKNDELVEQIYTNTYEQLRKLENGANYDIPTTETIRKFVEDEKSLKKFVKAYNEKHTNQINFTGDEHTHHQKAYKVMGIACHVIGDLYAHRTLATEAGFEEAFRLSEEKEEYAFSKSDFGNWNDFKALLIANRIECRDIHNYTPNCKSDRYEDNVYFMPERYSRALTVIKKLIGDNEENDFRIHIWDIGVLSNTTTLDSYNTYDY